jgi:hypothetical protein
MKSESTSSLLSLWCLSLPSINKILLKIFKTRILECDFCNEHKSFINLKYRYYNYGFSRHSYLACDDCHFDLFGPFTLIQVDTIHGVFSKRSYCCAIT